MPGEIWLTSLLFHSSENMFSFQLCDVVPIFSYFAKVGNQTFMVKDPFNFVFLGFTFLLAAFYFINNPNPHCCTELHIRSSPLSSYAPVRVDNSLLCSLVCSSAVRLSFD